MNIYQDTFFLFPLFFFFPGCQNHHQVSMTFIYILIFLKLKKRKKKGDRKHHHLSKESNHHACTFLIFTSHLLIMAHPPPAPLSLFFILSYKISPNYVFFFPFVQPNCIFLLFMACFTQLNENLRSFYLHFVQNHM